MGIFNKIKNSKIKNTGTGIKMMSLDTSVAYVWNGEMFSSDIIRACVRPFANAVGKSVAKHIRNDKEKGIQINPEPYMRFLLEEPNPLMSMQTLQEKVAIQLKLNNNAFILIVRDEAGYPTELYPIPCTFVESIIDKNKIYLKFCLKNGSTQIFAYNDVVHLRKDFNDNDIFGSSPASALGDLMENIGTVDASVKKAIKNSGVINWLLKYTASLRPEDLKKNVKDFTDNYLKIDVDTDDGMGAVGVDAKVDATRIEPKDYVPNVAISKQLQNRVYSFFNTNEKIVQSTYSEDEWISYYEADVEPVIEQMSAEFTRKLFSRRERGFGNKIVFESSNLTFASMSTKLQLSAFVDRGIMTPNEVRRILNLAPIDGGDAALLRKDTGLLEGGDNE